MKGWSYLVILATSEGMKRPGGKGEIIRYRGGSRIKRGS